MNLSLKRFLFLFYLGKRSLLYTARLNHTPSID